MECLDFNVALIVATLSFSFTLSACTTTTPVKASPAPAADACPTCPQGSDVEVGMDGSIATKLFVRGLVDGKPRKFHLDTGAYNTTLITDEQTKVFTAMGTVKSYGMADAVNECEKVRLPELKVAHLTRAGFDVERCASGVNSENNLGIDFFNRQIISLNFSKDDFSAIGKVPDGVVMSPLQRSSNGHIELPAKLAGETTLAIFDTGADVTVVDRAFFEKHRSFFKPLITTGQGAAPSAELTEATGRKMTTEVYRIDLQIGDYQLPDQPIGVMTFPDRLKAFSGNAAVILGANSIIKADWIFDLKANTWSALTPHATVAGFQGQVSSDRMTVNNETVLLEGHAVVRHTPLKVSGDEIRIDMKTHRLEAKGHCHFNDGREDYEDDKISIKFSNESWEILAN